MVNIKEAFEELSLNQDHGLGDAVTFHYNAKCLLPGGGLQYQPCDDVKLVLQVRRML
jgi:hypothetical protein